MEKLSALLGVVDLAVTGLVHVVPGHPQRQWRKRGRKGGEQRGRVLAEGLPSGAIPKIASRGRCYCAHFSDAETGQS